MEVDLAYGKKGLRIRIPDQYYTEVIRPRFVEGISDPQQALHDALAHPIDHPPLSSVIASHQTVAIIFSDITRATPYHLLVPALLDALAHLPDQNITFFCATGTHRPATSEELGAILGKKVSQRFRIVQNNSSSRKLFQHVGTSLSGNHILLNKEMMRHDLRILTGFIEPHFFAGFSGGGKALMPGMAYEGTIRHNHSIANLEHPRARWGHTHGNPLWEEVMEASEFAAPLFLLNISLNSKKEITGVFAGDLRSAHHEGCTFVQQNAMVRMDQPFDIVISSNSGYPLDLNVYQSVKGMSAAERIVKTGGSIIMAAECWDGIPAGSDYETILKSAGTIKELMSFIRAHEKEFKDTWQVYFQSMIQSRSDVYLYSSLEDHIVEQALMKPAGDIGSLVERLGSTYGPGTRICVLPEGPHTIPYLKDS